MPENEPTYIDVDASEMEKVNGEELFRLDYAFPEAPASVNFYAVTSQGWNCQFTLRDIDEQNLIKRFAAFAQQLQKAGVQPKQVGRQNSSSETAEQSSDTKRCSIHNVDMPARFSKKTGKKFYSHFDDQKDEWCYGSE